MLSTNALRDFDKHSDLLRQEDEEAVELMFRKSSRGVALKRNLDKPKFSKTQSSTFTDFLLNKTSRRDGTSPQKNGG